MAPARERPTRTMQLLNFVLFQAAWFAGVLGAANEQPLLGTLAVFAVIAWHISVSARPADEARLVLAALAIGAVFETFCVQLGQVAFTSGQPEPHLAPYWMVSMWGLLAIALNVTMRWMKRRWLLAAALGAIAGPVSYAAGVRLGAATFIHATAALTTLAISWAVLMPAMMWLSDRFDGVATSRA
ncbi:MAG: DUF2878 domain-containing protein [Burkholderiales bacterium]